MSIVMINTDNYKPLLVIICLCLQCLKYQFSDTHCIMHILCFLKNSFVFLFIYLLFMRVLRYVFIFLMFYVYVSCLSIFLCFICFMFIYSLFLLFYDFNFLQDDVHLTFASLLYFFVLYFLPRCIIRDLFLYFLFTIHFYFLLVFLPFPVNISILYPATSSYLFYCH